MSTPSCFVFIATSVDGFIARKDGVELRLTLVESRTFPSGLVRSTWRKA